MMYKNRNQQGYIALISVLIVSALILSVSIGVSLRSIHEGNMALLNTQSFQARALSLSCAEIALLRLQENLEYQGDEDIIVGGNMCYIHPVVGEGNIDRVVRTEAVFHDVVKKMIVVIPQVTTTTTVSLWKEVADF